MEHHHTWGITAIATLEERTATQLHIMASRQVVDKTLAWLKSPLSASAVGQGRPMTQTCPVCHGSKGIGDRFCTSCGHAFDPDPAAEPTAQPSPPDLKKLCVGCRTVNQAEATYCYRCGLNLPEATYPSMAGNPAGFWIRVAAYLMDEAIISLAAILLMNIFIGMDPNESVKQLVGASTGREIPLGIVTK